MPIGAKSPLFIWANIFVKFKHNEAMDGNLGAREQMEVNLEVMVQMSWYDMIHLTQERTKWGIWRGANTHTPPLNYREASLKAKIVKHAFDALQGELATMQTTPFEAELECNKVCEQLCKMKIEIEVLEHDIAYK